jgi:hypothetical protein
MLGKVAICDESNNITAGTNDRRFIRTCDKQGIFFSQCHHDVIDNILGMYY